VSGHLVAGTILWLAFRLPKSFGSGNEDELGGNGRGAGCEGCLRQML